MYHSEVSAFLLREEGVGVMEQSRNRLLFALLRSAVSGDPLTEAEKSSCSPSLIPALTAVAQKHHLSHLLAQGLVENTLDGIDAGSFTGNIFSAIYQYEQLNYALTQLCDALEAAQIPFVPLKGSVIRNYYPQPWMRLSSDIDILVHKSDIEQAAAYLVTHLGYTQGKTSAHDISLYTPGNLLIELHYDLIEDNFANEASRILRTVWDRCVLCDGCQYRYEMTDEMFYYYHIAHMAKHFELGGCGIRTFIDLWILDNCTSFYKEKRDALLNEGRLLKFANAARKLSHVWFEGLEPDKVSQEMENYILRGGVYGIIQNRVKVQQQKMGGKIKFLMKRIFLPYDDLKYTFPILQKRPWLTPVMEVWRWIRLIFKGRGKQCFTELNCGRTLSAGESADMQVFLKEIGLL